MIRFLTAFLLLLIPILLILIVRVRTRQRVLYSHTYLQPLGDRPLREFLFRTFQLYADVAFDLLLALLLAMILSGLLDPFPRRTAVCLDGSFSMTQGQASTPLDRALDLLAEGKVGAGRYRLFLLGFDPARGRHALISLGRSRRNLTSPELKRRLAFAPAFFSADPQELGSLFRRGFRRIIYITDRSPGAGANLEVIEVGEEPKSFFYPAAIAYRQEQGSFHIRILRSGFDGALEVQKFSDEAGEYRPYRSLPAAETGSPLSELEIRDEGLYRLSATIRTATLDFLLPLARRPVRVQPKGEFSMLVADLLPDIKQAPGGIVLQDVPWNPQEPAAAAKSLRRLRGILTVIPQPDAGPYPAARPYIHPLGYSFSQPSYAEMPVELVLMSTEAERLFYQDPHRFRDARTPLVYLSALEALRPPGPFLEARTLPRGARVSRARSGATCYAYTTSNGTAALNLPPEEFFRLPAGEELRFPAPAPPRLFYFLLLLTLYGLKLLFLVRFRSGGSVAKKHTLL
jgi:hypothetical protein